MRCGQLGGSRGWSWYKDSGQEGTGLGRVGFCNGTASILQERTQFRACSTFLGDLPNSFHRHLRITATRCLIRKESLLTSLLQDIIKTDSINNFLTSSRM